MEVHPPEHGIHSWRDFLVHMGTITLGLLIALGLEHLVEVQHQHHLVETARENLRDEVRENTATLRSNTAALNGVRRDVLTDLQTLRSLVAHPHQPQAHLVSEWIWDGLNDSAYTSARDTGALALLPYDTVQHIDALFTQQQYVERAAESYLHDVNAIRGPAAGRQTLSEASPAELDRMISSCSAALVDINLLEAFMRGLAHDYQRFAEQS